MNRRYVLKRFVCAAGLLILLCGGCGESDISGELSLSVAESHGVGNMGSTGETATGTENVNGETTEAEGQEENQVSFLMEGITPFAYASLTEVEQIWYRDIEQALGYMQEEVELTESCIDAGLDETSIDMIFQCVLNDHPEIFYVEGYTYVKYTRGDKIVSIEFSGTYNMDEETALGRKQEIEEGAAALLTGVDSNAPEYDKVKYVYETVIRNTDYVLGSPDNQNIYSVFVLHDSVCQGYAKATQYLLNKLGVACTLVQGSVDTGEGHAWNLVQVDGSFYYVDATWGDVSYQIESDHSPEEAYMPEINYDYLCITTAQLLRTHTLGGYVPMPECLDMAANYYVREGALFSSYNQQQMAELFARAYEAGRNDVTVKCLDILCYNEIRSALIDNQEIFQYVHKSSDTITYAHNEKQLSMTFWVTNK